MKTVVFHGIGDIRLDDRFFSIGMAMNKNLAIKMGNCNHRRSIPLLINDVRSGLTDPASILTQKQPFTSVLDAYKTFDTHREDWVKVELRPAA